MNKIKDTKLGKWLGENAPKALAVVGDLLPKEGYLGIVKNLITNSDLPEEKTAEGLKLVQEFELAMEQEMTKKTQAFQETERIQLQQDDKWTKRARPTRQYFWLFFLLFNYLIVPIWNDQPIDLPEIILIGIFTDFGLYTWKRSEEKKNSLKLR